MLAERQGRPVFDDDVGDAVGQPQRRLERIGQASFDAVFPDEPVDDDLDGVLVVAVERDVSGQIPHLAVDPGAAEPVPCEVLEELLVLALPPLDHGGEHLEAGALVDLEDPVDDLLRRLAGHGRSVVGTVGHTDPGVEEPEVVVDLGDGADGGAGVAARRLLIDRDRRGEPFDEVDVRLVHLAEELPGVCGEALDVAALPLGVDRVERQRRLAGAGQSGEDDQTVARQVQVEVPEVVLPRTTDVDRFARHGPAVVVGWFAECTDG